ncbi:hypothetical protein FVR03_16260 [Pontibacter qinzhouensis]|uniref:Outer membrane beta-barrel protein n=1 Tax=Pontibacter qinzhouensis TaxID=2603253 RepID=A0A5C8JFE4_9BACT|nr:hypothetical protein [Pontibacter qinzhouensis]TXK37030.1 hypothetical protein FVR03_16260 [Pontibacter qinzhouensis]
MLLLVCTLSIESYGQEEEPLQSVGTAYLGASYAIPLGGYRQAYPQANALGGTFGLLLNPRSYPSPLEVGVQVSYLSQGIDKNRSSFSNVYPIIKTSHSLVPLHLVARVKPQKPMRFKPYIDGLVGITIFNTRSKLKEDIFDFMRDDHEAIVLGKYRTTVFSCGIGAGMLLWESNSKNSFADIRVTYLQSPFTTYVRKRDVAVQQDGYPVYFFTRSETNMLQISLNISGVLTK